MYTIDDELKEFVESGVACIVGTGDANGRPQMAHGWAPRIAPDRTTAHVFIDAARAGAIVDNLHPNRRIAITLADPVSYRSVQLKGVVGETCPSGAADAAWVRQQREAFVAATSLIGDPPDMIRSMWSDDVVRLTVSVEHAFNQTPGPDAGKPL